MSKILFLGGNGFIGANLIEKLCFYNEKIIVLVREESDCTNLSNCLNQITLIKGDFGDEKLIKNILKDYDIEIVIHLITSILPNSHFNQFIEDTQTNFIQTIKLIQIISEHSKSKLIFFSSGGTVYGNNKSDYISESDNTEPINYYGWYKLSIENYIKMESKRNNLEYLILRPSNPYGKYQKIHSNQGIIAVSIGKILRKENIEIWGDGTTVRDYIYIDDMCDYVFKLIKYSKWNEIYNIGSNIGTSINEIIYALKDVTKIDFSIIYQQSRNVDVKSNILNIDKLRKVINLNESNTKSIKDGIYCFWEYVIKNQIN